MYYEIKAEQLDKIIAKQKELIKHIYPHLKRGAIKDYHLWYDKKVELESELAALEIVINK